MAFQRLGLKNYNQHSYWQQVENMLWLDYFATVTEPAYNKKITKIADFGSSEGVNSIKFFGTLISKYLSQRPNDYSVIMNHCDLPENNWNNFFKTLNSSPDSYIKFPFVYPRIIGKSFYNQLFEDNSLDISYSAQSFHYLSKIPERLPNDYNYYHSNIPKQGIQDMKHLINLRLKELTSGGYLFMMCIAKVTDIPSFIRLTDEAFLNCMEKGLLNKEEMLSMCCNVFALNQNEFDIVLDSISDKAEVVMYRFCKSMSPYYLEYLNDKNHEKYIESLYEFNNVLIDRMLKEKLALFGKSHLSEEINGEFKRVIKESKIASFCDYAVLLLKKK
jgi:hypothetical protein